MTAGIASIWMPDGSINKITDSYVYDGIRPSTEIYDFPRRFMVGYELNPGVHYYLTPKRIIFLQAQYLQCSDRTFFDSQDIIIRSLGLSAGIYF